RRPTMPACSIMRLLAPAVAILLGTHGAPARADGAFPDSQRILVPEDRPDTIVLATNFGLVVSEDGGALWRYACETLDTSGGHLYSLGPAPDDRVYAISTSGVATSRDLGCSWSVGGGL